ncbi:class I SAM-dependent methyltransferase [Pseudokineococcus lusitanus]|uniref:Putative nicotinamide N-methyase n=1 Tax=Pseudokineococcus lusitanus TaxID=763993 RepID=A0A3N1HT76_9ACTN|nr:50S ribosomal protein L11 methyltransferase [Pseudokineococcus lusitanus]ROP45724.1 putative nicotinamide N-methyase [Pseudokineococcus lusitanus]
MDPDAPLDLARWGARAAAVPLVPEVVVPVVDDVVALWERTDAAAGRPQPPPFWGAPWVGGQALARHVLDRPDLVAGRAVVDVACGSGVVAVAAALAGASAVTALDLDPLAAAAARWTAARAGVVVDVRVADVLAAGPGPLDGADVVLVGDLFYERPVAEALLPLLERCADGGALVLVGDPGRAHLPTGRLAEVGRYAVPVVGDVEDAGTRSTGVLRVSGAARPGPPAASAGGCGGSAARA